MVMGFWDGYFLDSDRGRDTTHDLALKQQRLVASGVRVSTLIYIYKLCNLCPKIQRCDSLKMKKSEFFVKDMCKIMTQIY